MDNDLILAEQELYLRNLRESLSENTIRTYSSCLKAFTAWCGAAGVSSCPAAPYTVSLYIDHLRDRRVSVGYIDSSIAAISKLHSILGVTDPTEDKTVRTALRAASRALGRAQKPKEALTIDLVEKILLAIDCEGLINLRDRALIAVGFMSACRRSELSALQVSDITREHKREHKQKHIYEHEHKYDVVVLRIRHSKTDPMGSGLDKCIFHTQRVDAVAELQRWLDAARMPSDYPLFPQIRRGGHIQPEALSGHSIAAIVQARATAAGLNMDVGGHSLRRGFVTSALNQGATERSVMHQTGHKSVSVLRQYQERRDVRTDNAASLF